MRQGPDGAIYLLTDNAKGRILKLVPKSVEGFGIREARAGDVPVPGSGFPSKSEHSEQLRPDIPPTMGPTTGIQA